MNQQDVDVFIRHVVKRHLSHLLPEEIADALKQPDSQQSLSADLEYRLEEWDRKISVQSYWQGVLTDYDAERTNTLISLYKQALFSNRKLKISDEQRPDANLFNPFGLVARNRQYFFVGSYENSREPNLLPVNKVNGLSLAEETALPPNDDFDLDDFSATYLNHPVEPIMIDHLIVEFPEKSYFYVKSHPICCEKLNITKPQGSPGYFNLEAFAVPNTVKLHEWLSGFQDDAQILTPLFLRLKINRSFVDQLTNLYNRNAFERLGQREIERYLRSHQCHFSLLVMDIDHFKSINDEHGHLFGDEVLIKVAECLRGYDAIRYGGEEFAVLLPDTRAEQALTVAERIRKNIEQLSLQNDENYQVPITISIGIAEFPGHLTASDHKILSSQEKTKASDKFKASMMAAITGQADKALYQAKKSGRNQSMIYRVDFS